MSGRATAAIVATYAAAPIAGAAAALAWTRHPAAAVAAGLVAIVLIVLALGWALKQENRR